MSVAVSSSQQEALQELVKIGYARAAAALSDLTCQAVRVGSPSMTVHHGRDLAFEISQRIRGRLACVKQAFHGPVTGYVFLIMDECAMLNLSAAAAGRPPGSTTGQAEEREEVAEIGQILMSAYLGAFGNLLRFHLTFAVPRLDVGGGAAIAQSVQKTSLGLGQALIMKTGLHDFAGARSGDVLLILGFISIDQLTAQIQAWDCRNGL